ncbi:potassium-transporting ATPase subunit KdpC [Granulicella sp. WH15]|uniref:potassium-transporting ATPase subunit KdpC n=1 Tax=Granulicella sp. WH15 TaxID=2602070 RepID=UPI001366E001|nr:potassium-transporting ATPase subunit KdpC [Granulicella sp. WH15]QHN02242.1 potassium-transporting ATPase subunit KdpC [Granulicella sp. WH15]
MRRTLITAVLFTLVTTVIFGLAYPLLVTGLAQLFFKDKANGQLIKKDGVLVGSRLIGQPFSSPKYFHSRPSAAGSGYDAANSGGSNLGPTNQKLIDRMKQDAAVAEMDHPGSDVPIDLVTTSASGLDPDITPAGAEYQVARIARERGLTPDAVHRLVLKHTEPRQFGVLGEAHVNVLELNLELDQLTK